MVVPVLGSFDFIWEGNEGMVLRKRNFHPETRMEVLHFGAQVPKHFAYTENFYCHIFMLWLEMFLFAIGVIAI
jgi:hypothetical protein